MTVLATTTMAESLATDSTDTPVWLTVGTAIDGLSAGPITNAHIVYDQRCIRYIGDQHPPAELIRPSQTAPDVSLPDHVALPGLIEAHAHLFLDGAPINFDQRKAYLDESSAWMLARAKTRLPKLIQLGVMAVRDAGDNRGVGLALRDVYRKMGLGTTHGPYIDSPGSAIHCRGRYGSFMGEPHEDHADLTACVAARVNAGADRIKLLATGIINFKKGRVTAPPQLSTEQIATIVAAAKAHNKPTFAHASGTDGIEHCIEGGVDTVEHGFFITRDQLAKMRDRDIAWVPTLAPVQLQIDRATELGWDSVVVDHLRTIIERHLEHIDHAQSIGVPVIAGSDAGSCGVPHGFGLIREMELMMRAGMSTLDVLNAATGTSSRYLQFNEPFGALCAGNRPRLIITEHSPLTTVINLTKAKITVFDGHVVLTDDVHDANGL